MKLQLILEREGNILWGRVCYEKNLIVDSATTLDALERKMNKLLNDFHKIRNVEFQHQYGLTIFFDQFNFLNQSKIAELAGINPGLLRQYASGVKHPSKEQANKIQVAVRGLASKLKNIKIYG